MNWIEKYDNFMINYLNCNNKYLDINKETCITKYIIHGKLLRTYLSVDKIKVNIKDNSISHIETNLLKLLDTIIQYNKCIFKKKPEETFKECRDIFAKKNSDYGNSFLDYNLIGILVRLNDKINRTDNLINLKKDSINYESIYDTIIDSFNYIVLSLLFLKE